MLVGRRTELERLQAAISRPGVVLLVGGPGIGKTAVVEAVASGRPAIVGQAVASLGHRPGAPVLHALGLPPDLDAAHLAPLVLGHLPPDTLLVLEDLHWADGATIEVLADLHHHRPVLATTRPGVGRGDVLIRQVTSIGGEVLRLGPMDEDDLTELAGRVQPELVPSERRRVAAQAGGVPLVAEALARSEGGRPVGADRAALEAIVARLDETTRLGLGTLGAADGPVPPALVAHAEALVAAGFATLDGEEVVATGTIFAALAWEGLDPATRATIHHHLAEHEHRDTTARARHLYGAGDDAEALVTALQAASGPVPLAEQAANLALATRAAERLGPDGCAALSGRTGPLDVDDLRVRAARGLNDCAEHDAALELVRHPATVAPPLRVPAALEALRAVHDGRDRTHAGETVEETGPLLAGATGGEADLARALRDALVEPRSREAEVRVHRLRDDHADLDAARDHIAVLIALGRHVEAQAAVADGIARAEKAGAQRWVLDLRTLDVLSRFYHGADQDDAIAWLSFVRTAPARLDTRATATSTLATVLADRGFAERSGVVLADWLDQERIGTLEPLSAAILLWGAAQRAWILGELGETIRLGRWATDLLGHGFPTLAGTQVVWRWAEYESGAALTAPEPAGGLLDAAAVEAEALALLAAGHPSDAAGGFREAADAWRPILWRCTLRARWGEGHALARAGDPAAVEVLRSVDGELDRSHLQALRPRVHASLRLARGHPDGGDDRHGDAGPDPVTARERAVLGLVAEGYRTGEIAWRLGIAPDTVNGHVRSATRKLGVRTRIEAAARLGLIVGDARATWQELGVDGRPRGEES